MPQRLDVRIRVDMNSNLIISGQILGVQLGEWQRRSFRISRNVDEVIPRILATFMDAAIQASLTGDHRVRTLHLGREGSLGWTQTVVPTRAEHQQSDPVA